MPIKRVNSTGRKKIMREDAQIYIRPDPDGVLAFSARLQLTEYDLPSDARVFVEAYRQTMYMRFEHGTVGEPQPAPGIPLRLTEFRSPEGLLFRVKVTSTGERPGLLLAHVDQIPMSNDDEEPDKRDELLPPVQADLGEEVWRLDFSGARGPLLLVNEKLEDWKATVASWGFRSLVFPAAMRLVLWHVVSERKVRDTEDPEDWGSRWLEFAHSLPGAGELPDGDPDDFDPEEWAQWIESATESFSRQHQMLHHYSTHLGAEGST